MNKYAQTVLTLVAVAVVVGVVLLLSFAVGRIYDATHEDRDYETERLAEDMAHSLRNLASTCAYSNDMPASTYCQDAYSHIQNICKGTVAPQLEDFCKDWEVITYIKVGGAMMATSMIRLAQDIEEWLEWCLPAEEGRDE